MKVLFVTGIFPPDHGGPASYVPAIAAELRNRQHEIVAVITLSDRLDGDDSGCGFPIVRLRRSLPRPLRVIQTVWTIARLARRADVVYLNGLVLEGIIATRWFGRTRTVIKVVGDLIWERARNSNATDLILDEFQVAPLPMRWRFMRWLQSWYTARADLVIVPSNYLKAIVRGWGVDLEKIRVIHNAVPLPPPATTAVPHYDLITVARLVPWKGIAGLIDVASAGGWSLRIVGDGPLMPELTKYAAGLNANVSFAGHVPSDRVCDEIRDARLFVLNSSYEGLPHIVLEAKAAGVPVVATTAGGTPEIMNHNVDGLTVPVGDQAALTSAIRHLLSHNSERERLQAMGRHQVETNYSFHALAGATEQALLGG